MSIKRILGLPVLIALFLPSAQAPSHSQMAAVFDSKGLEGEYIYSTGFVGSSFTLAADGSFQYGTFSDCCDPVWRDAGSYTVRGNLLHFKVTTKTLNNYNMLDLKQAIEAYRKVYNRSDGEIPADQKRTGYDMQIVRWGGRIYLLDPELLPRFVAAVNFGIEPRNRTIAGNAIAYGFFLRPSDLKKAVTGKPSLPEPWLSYLLDTPIKATIIKIEEKNNEEIYTVNKGSASGLKVSMILVGQRVKPDYKTLLIVIGVKEGSATLKRLLGNWGESYEVGSILTTKARRSQR